MTVKDLMELVERLHPNQFSTDDKLRWLNEVEKTLYHEIICTHEDGDDIEEPTYTNAASATDVLLAADPWSRLYPLWMEQKIAHYNHEVMQQDAAAAAFNEAYTTFRNAYNRAHMPKGQVNHLHLLDRTWGVS